jgi:hypothetical protein
VTIPISLILYIIYIACLPTPHKAIIRGFLVLFHIDMWSPFTIYHHLNLLPSPFPLQLVALPHTHCTYFTVVIFITNIWVNIQRGVSMQCGCALVWSVQSLLILFLTPLPPIPSFSIAFNIHSYILYLHIL